MVRPCFSQYLQQLKPTKAHVRNYPTVIYKHAQDTFSVGWEERALDTFREAMTTWSMAKPFVRERLETIFLENVEITQLLISGNLTIFLQSYIMFHENDVMSGKFNIEYSSTTCETITLYLFSNSWRDCTKKQQLHLQGIYSHYG